MIFMILQVCRLSIPFSCRRSFVDRCGVMQLAVQQAVRPAVGPRVGKLGRGRGQHAEQHERSDAEAPPLAC